MHFLKTVYLGIGLSLIITTPLRSQSIKFAASGNAVDVVYNDVVRLKGGLPKIENHPVESKMRHARDRFIFGSDQQQITISVRPTNHSATVALYVSASSADNIRMNEFVGVFFTAAPNYKQGMTFYRYKPWNSWTKPVRIAAPRQMESWDNQFFYWQYNDGVYGVMLPLSDGGYRTTLGSDGDTFGSKATAYVDKDMASDVPAMVIGFGVDLYKVTQETYESAMALTNRSENLAWRKKFPEPFEYLGWCTWNASSLGSNLNDTTVVRGVETFTKNNFPLGWVLIDDGWFNHRNSRLRSLRPDSIKFPNGFKPLITKLKNELHVKHIGFWHAFNGYWNGIDPDSPLGNHYKNEMFSWIQRERVDQEDSPNATYYFIKPSSDSLVAFYNTLHRYLRDEGATFIKVDNQLSAERMAQNNFAIGDLARAMHVAVNSSAKKYFDNAMINCMDMTPDAYTNFGSTPIARSVEDYFPYEKGETYNIQHGNAAAHIVQGIYNNLYFSQMVFPDLDMFQSHNPNGEFHAIARAINNGPIYVTDNAGEQNFEILRRLITADGRILRADKPLLPTRDCLFQLQDQKPFKAFSECNNIGLLGVWNAADCDYVSGTISPSDIMSFKGGEFAVFEVFSKKLSLCDYKAALPVSLARLKYQLYYIAKLRYGMAPLGILDKYNAPATMKSALIADKQMTIVVRDSGQFGAVLPRAPKKVFVNGRDEKMFNFDNGLFTLQLRSEKDTGDFKIELQL